MKWVKACLNSATDWNGGRTIEINRYLIETSKIKKSLDPKSTENGILQMPVESYVAKSNS